MLGICLSIRPVPSAVSSLRQFNYRAHAIWEELRTEQGGLPAEWSLHGGSRLIPRPAQGRRKDVNTKSSAAADSCANVALSAYSSHNTLPDFLWCPPDVLLCPGNTRRWQQQQPHPPSSLHHHHLYAREEKNLLKKEEKKLRADDSMTVSAAAVLSDFIGAQRIRNRSLGSGGS
ncbi:Uncharacterized protein FWK35_00000202 [Aphis craccivora]|uniref:Uncharacterized protein n=1 Tax=Aphis craccivora TaxID=307492 RepID=A0A6G0ZR05_APHCR|nr:Uncharacterized protein FWK35_00000202 [Aphis craccivora]